MATKILIDFPIEDPLSEYFSIYGIEHDRLPENHYSDPLIDIIKYRIGSEKNAIIFLDNLNFLRLFKEKSKYGSFTDFIRKNNHRLILYGDDLMRFLSDEIDNPIADWISQLEMSVIISGVPGKMLKEKYKKFDWVLFPYKFTSPTTSFPHFITLKENGKQTKDFLYLSVDRSFRQHRKILYDKMVENNLIENGIVRFHQNSDEMRVNLRSDFNKNFKCDFSPYLISVPPIDLYSDTYLELVVETLGHYEDNSFLLTEKTVKPISMKHPFMVLSTRNFLKNMQEYAGFLTFKEHLDETYDEKETIADRANIIIENLKMLSGKYKKFYKDTEEIREHNFKNLLNLQGRYRTECWQVFDRFWKNFK